MLGDPCRPLAQGDRCDRRSVRPLHPAGHSRLYPVRQRTGVPRQGSTGMDRDQGARIARIQAASTGGICPCLRRVAGCATPTGSAGPASATASLKTNIPPGPLSGGQSAAIRDYLSDSKPRMHSFGIVSWSSCLRFKRCTMVPNSSCRHLADFDDDSLAKTWLYDVNTTPMKLSFMGCPFRPVTPKKVVSGQSLRA